MDNMIYIATSILAMRCENYTPSCSHACLKLSIAYVIAVLTVYVPVIVSVNDILYSHLISQRQLSTLSGRFDQG